jgi:cytochrome P450
MVNELYVSKNKYFDKHPRIGQVLHPLLGDSTLFSRNDETWSKKRKALSATFYKEKLVKYFNLIKHEQLSHIEEIKEKYLKTDKPMDIIAEINVAHIKVLL